MATKSSARNWILKGILYATLFAGVFIYSLWRCFPYADAAGYISQLLKQKGLIVSINDIEPGRFPSLSIASLKISKEKTPWSTVEFKNIKAEIPLSDIFRRQLSAKIQTSTMGGKINAKLTAINSAPLIDLSWTSLDLSQFPRPPILSEVAVAGLSSGRLETAIDASTIEKLGGLITSDFSGTKLGPGRIMGIPVPQISLGHGKLNLSGDKGEIQIKTASFEGGDLGINFDGDVRLRNDLPKSLIYGNLELRPEPKLDKDLSLALGMLGIAKASDGTYKTRVRGRLAAPLFKTQ